MHLKTVVLWVFLLGTVRCGDYSESFRCAAGPTNINLKIYRNQTGHWQAQVQLEHTDVEEDVAAWDVDTDRTLTTGCDGSGSVLLVANFTVPLQGNPAVKTQPKKRIPEGYRIFSENHYFKTHKEPAIWVEAREICDKEGGHLAVINSEAEARFIAAIWTFTSDWAFIGFHDLYVEGNYITIYNQTLSDTGYDKRYPGEPNGGNTENCGAMNRNTLLGNYFCPLPLPFFCELEY